MKGNKLKFLDYFLRQNKDWVGVAEKKWIQNRLYMTKAGNSFFYNNYCLKILTDDGKQLVLQSEQCTERSGSVPSLLLHRRYMR